MSIRKIEVKFDTTQLDDRYVSPEALSVVEDKIVYNSNQIDCIKYEIEKINATAEDLSHKDLKDLQYRIDLIEQLIQQHAENINQLYSELQKQKIELTLLFESATKEEENPFYNIFKTTYQNK